MQTGSYDDLGQVLALAPEVAGGWAAFTLDHGDWVGYVDQRTGRLGYAEGGGIAWVPGRGKGPHQP